jgi:uncharacterized membrane protein YjfL (UPF0719 family)
MPSEKMKQNNMVTKRYTQAGRLRSHVSPLSHAAKNLKKMLAFVFWFIHAFVVYIKSGCSKGNL